MKKEKGNYDAHHTYLYQHCLKEWWPALDANRQIAHYKKNEIIFNEGDAVEGVFFMVDGMVKVHKHWTDDKELIIRFAANQDIIGHRGLSTNNHAYPISATVLADATVCFITMPFFYSTLHVNPGFAKHFLMFMADELQLSEQRMRDLAHMQVKGRVAKALLGIENKFKVNKDGFISFAISRQDIASYTGAAYETVYKLLTEFSETGLIATDGKYIMLKNKSALEEMTK